MPPSEDVAALIRSGVAAVLDAPAEWLNEMNRAAMHPAGMERVVVDDDLLATAVRINEGNLTHWAVCNQNAPGVRVPVNMNEETAAFIRDLVRRGFDAGALDSFRSAQNTAWRIWMQICFALTDDPELLKELLDVTSTSIATFIDDTVGELTRQIEVARAELVGDDHAQRRAAVALVLDGAPISPARAHAQLRYRIDGQQTALVVSADGAVAPDDLEELCEMIMLESGATRRLTVVAGTGHLWVWLPVDRVFVDRALAAYPHARVVIGEPGEGREGFRRSHFQALESRRLLTRLGSTARTARYGELGLVAAMTDDLTALDEFVAHTLGDLVDADPGLRESMRAWLAAECNASAAAAHLYTHRNTVVRHVARAKELLPQPLEVDLVAVAAALEVLRWRG